MRLFFDSFWRATAYCLHPRVIGLSLMPLLVMGAAAFALGYFFWEPAVAGVTAWLQTYELQQGLVTVLERFGFDGLQARFERFLVVLAPLVVVLAATPLLVFGTLLLVALGMTPAMVDLVAKRRFAQLEARHGGGWWSSLAWSLGSTIVATLALLVSLPLWLVPPLVLVLPPLIWGWLTYRVFAFDALAVHASADERRQLLRGHRGMLLLMGVITGFLGAAPSLLWASGVMFVAMAPLLVPIAIWIYTLVFAFASLWFAHYLLAALEAERVRESVRPPAKPPGDAATRTPAQVEVVDVQAKPLPPAAELPPPSP